MQTYEAPNVTNATFLFVIPKNTKHAAAKNQSFLAVSFFTKSHLSVASIIHHCRFIHKCMIAPLIFQFPALQFGRTYHWRQSNDMLIGHGKLPFFRQEGHDNLISRSDNGRDAVHRAILFLFHL